MFRNFNDHEWILHLTCSQTDFNLIYTHKIKSEIQTMIRHEINLIRIRFDEKMIFFRIDEKKSLNDNIKKFIVSLKILYESSSSDISIQNDHLKKKPSAHYKNESVIDRDRIVSIFLIMNHSISWLFHESYADEKARLKNLIWNRFENQTSFRSYEKIRLQSLFFR